MRHKISHIHLCIRFFFHRKRHILCFPTVSPTGKTGIRKVSVRSAHVDPLCHAAKDLSAFLTAVDQIDQRNQAIGLPCTFLQNIMDPGQCTLGKHRLLFNQYIILALNLVKLPLHFIDQLAGLFVHVQTPSDPPVLQRAGYHRMQTFLYFRLFQRIFLQNLAHQLFHRFFIPVKAVGRCQDRIFPAVAVIQLFHKNLLDTDKIFLTRQFVKICPHTVLHIGKQLTECTGCLQGGAQDIVILLRIPCIGKKCTVDRQHTLPFPAVIVPLQLLKYLGKQLAVLREGDYIGVQTLIIFASDPAPLQQVIVNNFRRYLP